MRGKFAASLCRQVAAWVPDMLLNLHLVKNYTTAKNSTTSKVREKISTDLESLELIFNVFFTKFKNNQILLHKMSHRFLLTTKLFTG